MSALSTLEQDARTAGVPYFDPDDYLINAIRRATAHGQDLRVSADGFGELVVASGRGEYFTSIGDMAAFCRLPVNRLRVSVDSRGAAPSGTGRNIDELMWSAAFHASDGRLMLGCYRDDVVELRHWPNFTRLPHTPNSLRIAALLVQHPTSVTLAARLLKIEREELYQFYSAARCAGLARAVNRKPEEPTLAPHRHQTLLAALLNKIAGI
jgi:hypothetical protein